ncbi:MAG TPA: IS1634 family transposase [Solirubrobacteraceae bacterium]|nr:IS1634 family transposase [Solirubrobacteraceae bacterium]
MSRKPREFGAMHVVTTRRRVGEREYTNTLLRRSYREDGKVKKETLANLSRLPPEAIDAVRAALRGEVLVAAGAAFEIERSVPAGHAQAALEMARRLELGRLLDRSPSRERDLVLAMICQRAIAPASKLGTVRAFDRSTLAQELGVAGVDEDDLYAAMDWLLERQARIEDRLARRHLRDGELVLYDVSSSYFEGRSCELAKLGYSRDQKRGSLQIIYGLLCDKPGRPIAIEVFSGELHDDKTLPSQIEKLKRRFGLSRVVVVSDRGMVTKANIELLEAAEARWITALKAPQIQKLARQQELQLSLFDQTNLAEITSEDYPGERLVVCRNPLVAAERARKRSELLEATERGLSEIAQRVERGTLHGADQIGLAVGPALKRYKVKKHFEVTITETTFTYQRKTEQIHAEAALDGIYVLRTNLTNDELSTGEVVRSYKGLEQVERAFRSFKGPDLEIRPIHHRLEDRVRAHVFLCMLAYYLTWHLRDVWRALLFGDENPPVQPDPVAKAVRSPAAQRKARTKRTSTGEPCHSYKSLLAELATLTRNTIRLPGATATFDKLAQPTPLQARALDLIQHASLDS